MLTVLVVCIFLLLIYTVWAVMSLTKGQALVATFLEMQFKELKAAQKPPSKLLAYGWFDDGWPMEKVDEEDRAPLENPAPQRNPDEYATQMYISEFKSMPSAHQRKEFLRQLFHDGVWMRPELLDVIYADESAFVRAWAAGHLETDFKDFTADIRNPREIRN